MAIGKTNAGGGGGAALNFKVVPGLTQPGTASENTIWVKTERIGAWYFSATQPEGMQEWDVWFPTGIESVAEFNALRKNGLQVYPLSAKQMVSGSLVDVNAMSYQNGKWVEWRTYLYNNGDQCTDITGGWVSRVGTGGTVTFDNDSIKLSYKGSSGRQATIYTKNKINLANVSTLYAVVECTDIPASSSSMLTLAICETNTEYNLPNVACTHVSEVGNHVIPLDVSDYPGEYYVGLRSMYATSIVTEIYMM